MRILIALLVAATAASTALAAEDQMMFPNEAIGVTCQGPASPSRTMVCAKVIAQRTITSAVDFGTIMVTTSGTAQCGAALYSLDGSTRLFEVHGACTAGQLKGTGLSAQTISKGTYYLDCVCATNTTSGANATCSGTGAAFLVGQDVNGTGSGHFADFSNALFTSAFSTAANLCDISTGQPPATTGALTVTTTWRHAPVLTLHHP